MSKQFTKSSRHTTRKAGDRVLIEAVVESVFDGVTNWPIKILLDRGDSETIDGSRNVHYSAIHPLSEIQGHDALVKALERIRDNTHGIPDWKALEMCRTIAREALAKATA